MYDAIIIGAGISGSCLARELSRYKLHVAVLEKGSDVCAAASRGNSATVHSGHDATFGTLKAKYNVLGNALYDKLCAELDVPFKRNGTTIIATSKKELSELYRLKENADKNGVPNTRIVNQQELSEIEDYFGPSVIAALFAPSGGVVCPYQLVIALCENASENGVEFFLNTEALDIQKTDFGFNVRTSVSDFQTRFVFNCAGTHADDVNDMICPHSFTITPRSGEHILLDKKLAPYVKSTISQTPSDLPGGGHTKGMGLIPSVDGTIILGCDAHEAKSKDDSPTTDIGLGEICEYFERNWSCLPISKEFPKFPRHMIIGAFGGLRPHPDTDDFIIGESAEVQGFFNMAGIESPGLTAAPAIAAALSEAVADKYGFDSNPAFQPIRARKKTFREMTEAERIAAIAEDSDYGHIVCRCEQVTKAEILQAIRSAVGARSVNAVKMRTRAGMGRCQGGFCSPEVMKLLSQELEKDMLEITQSGKGSEILMCETCREDEA